MNDIKERILKIREEAKCPCAVCQTYANTRGAEIDEDLIINIINLENRLKKKVKITSGERCPEYNYSIKGYKDSPHLTGKAFDIQVEGMSILELAREANNMGFKRIGIYPNHVHVDMISPRPSKYWYVREYNQPAVYSKGIKDLEIFINKVA